MSKARVGKGKKAVRVTGTAEALEAIEKLEEAISIATEALEGLEAAVSGVEQFDARSVVTASAADERAKKVMGKTQNLVAAMLATTDKLRLRVKLALQVGAPPGRRLIDVPVVGAHYFSPGFWTVPYDASPRSKDVPSKKGASMVPVAEALPSKETVQPWIHVQGAGLRAQKAEETVVGKWLIFVLREHVDGVWRNVKRATEDGSLGFAAKVSTSRPSSYNSAKHVICVYTSDFRNKNDVARVLAGLRNIGVGGKLSYKTDQATLNGVYSQDGPFTKTKARASLYSSTDFE